MPTLAELRAQSGPRPLPRATKIVTLIEGQHLLAEFQKLAEETADLAREESTLKSRVTRTDGEGNQSGPPRKAGEGAADARRLEEIQVRLAEIDERLPGIADDLGGFQGEVGLTGLTGGDWQRFKDENPPREESGEDVRVDKNGNRPLNRNDMRFASGLCNSTAVFGALGKFVTSWDGEPATETDWDEWLAERITYADRRDLIAEVVKMHEQGAARSPKFRSGSPTTNRSESV